MNLFTFIKERVPILDVVSEYVSLKPAGSYWKGLSPFKDEKTPSFTVSPSRGIYYCFSTAQGGDVIDFVAKIENCSPLEAAQLLAERHQITIPPEIRQNFDEKSPGKNERQLYEKTCSFFAAWCNQQLSLNSGPFNYFKERGLTDQTIAQFLLGYCPSGPAAVTVLINDARRHGLLTSDLIQAHLIAEGASGLYTPFEDRIIFPIADHLGRTCGFGGRIFRPNDDRPKYYNSREHDLFKKKQILYGLHLAKKMIQSTEKVYLVEGYMDCIAMVQMGYKNCVATLGTACTVEHLSHLSRLSQTVTVMYDGDEAGQQAMLRLAQLCWQVRLELMVLTLPPKEDPASFLSKNKNLESIENNQKNIFSFFIQTLGNTFMRQQLQDKLLTIRQLLSAIAPLPDPLQQEILLQQAASAFDVPINSLKQELLSIRKKTEVTPIKNSPISPAFDLEKKIFSVILSSGINLSAQDEAFLEKHLTQPFQRFFCMLRESAWDFNSFFSHLSDEDRQLVSGITLAATEPVTAEVFGELMGHLKRKWWKDAIGEVKIRLGQARKTGDEKTVQEALIELQKLQEALLHGGIL